MRKQTHVSWLTARFCLMKLALGRMPIFTRRWRASTLEIISVRLSKNGPMVTFASDTSLPRHTSASWRGWLGKCGNMFWLLRTILGIKAETATVSLRTLAFFFPLVTDTFSSCNTNDSLSTLYHGSRFNSPMPGVKVSQTEFLICTPLHHGFQLLIVKNRFLLMNLHVVQFQDFFALIRLTYRQFVQTFQDFIGWNFYHR